MAGIPSILQLNKAGLPQKWIDYEKAAYYYCKGLISWVAGMNEVTLTGGVSRITGDISTLSMNSIIAVNGDVSPRAYKYPPTLTNQTLFRRDGNVCAYCGQTYNFKTLTRDHIMPSAKGGKNTWTNVVTACKGCNNYKGDKLLSDLDMDLRYQPYEPSKAEYMILSNKAILDDQYDFLLKMIGEGSRVHQFHKRPEAPEELTGLLTGSAA